MKGMKNSNYCRNYKIYGDLNKVSTYDLYPNGNKIGEKKRIVEEFRKMFYYNKYKIVPTVILKSSFNIRKAFFEGYYDGDGKYSRNTKYFHMKGKIVISTIALLCHSIGYKFSINYTLSNLLDTYSMTVTKNKFHKNPIKIKKIIPLSCEDWVYDLETENHHFAAGIGNLICHNTDSVYVTVPENNFDEIDNKYYSNRINKLEYCNELINITFREIKIVNDLINKKLIEDNGSKFLRLNFEESGFTAVFIR